MVKLRTTKGEPPELIPRPRPRPLPLLAGLFFATLLLGSCAVLPDHNPTRYAAIFGVSDYANMADDDDLQGPANDAGKLQVALQARGYQTRLGVDSDATLAGMQTAITDIAGAILPGDMLLFYFGGHGLAPGDLGYGKPAALLPHEWDPANASATAISPQILAELFNPLPDGVAVVVIMDACFSGGLIGQQGSAVDGVDANYSTNPFYWEGPSGGPSFINSAASYFEQQSTPQYGRPISFLSAAGAAEESWEYSETGSDWKGAFSELLVQRIEAGSADKNGDGRTSLDELYAAVRGDLMRTWNTLDFGGSGDYQFLPHRSTEYYDIVLF